MNLSIGLNIILALVFALICIIYLYEKETRAIEIEKEQYKEKHDSINPTPKNIDSDKDIINFLFSIQDFYVFNPQAFEEVIDNIDSFKILYENVFADATLSDYYYQIADSKKSNALNAFHSIIFTLPNDKIYTEKFNRAHKRLETILNKYLNEMYDQCTFYLYKNGHDILKRQILEGPREYNHYFDKEFTYQFY